MLPHHKGKRLDKKGMLHVLRELDTNLTGIQRKLKLYCLGGTVLVLSDLRHSSKDVDFIVSEEDFRALAGRDTDMKDINLLAPSKELVPKKELIKRFNSVKPAPNEAEELKKQIREVYF